MAPDFDGTKLPESIFKSHTERRFLNCTTRFKTKLSPETLGRDLKFCAKGNGFLHQFGFACINRVLKDGASNQIMHQQRRVQMKQSKFWKLVIVVFMVLAFSAVSLSVSAADKKPITRKMLLGGRLGDSWFVLSQALAYFVNKQSDWLRLEVVATPGVSAGPEIASKDPDKYVFISPYAGMTLNPTLKKINYYDKDLIMGYCTSNVWVWITYDDKIKTAQDLVGKKVFIGRPGGSRTVYETKVLEALGIKDKVKILHGGYGGGRNALRDGLADVGVMMIDYILPAGFKKGAFIEDLETRKPIHYINLMPREMQLKLGMVPLKIFAGALDPKTQKEDLYATVDSVYWCADERMDPDIVHEVTRILYANADKFASWHAQGGGISKESVSTYIIKPERMHPIARKYYEGAGAKIRPLGDLLP
jgi:TRAP-type uncharacterized transport system substrate-binding protein